jgi:RHS repeat-associated protein
VRSKVRKTSDPADDKTVEYTWDYRNRLEKVTFKRNDGTVTKRVEYYYDMFNRWTKRVLDYDGDTGSATPRVDRLIYDGDVLIQDFTEYSDSHSFMHGPLSDMVIFDYHESELRIPLGDHLNTIRDVVAHDGSDWNIVNHVTIDSFGRRTAESDDTIEVFHGLGGRPYDEETGLQNHHHRWYSVDSGRWISEDPIGFGGGHANLNVYTGNSPVNGVDPSGLVPGGWGAQEIATWKARRFEEVSQIYAEAGIPIPQSVLESFGYFIPTDPKIPDGPLESVIASFSSIPTLGAAWGADWAGDDAKADELYDEAYLQSPIGQLDDSPVMQGFAVAGLVIAGTALAVAGGVIAINAFGGPTMSVTIVRGDSIIKPIHAGWRLYGPWMHAQGIFGRVLPRTMGTGGSGFWTGGPGYWNTITGIPIRNATAAAAVEGPFWNCVTAVGTVIRTGWGW